MSDRDAEVLVSLKSIDQSLKMLVAIAQRKALDRVTAAASKPGPIVASDHDLDGQYGDPVVKAKDPRDWTGEPMNGRKFSECPPEYLEMVAERKDYFVSQNPQATDEDKKKAKYDRLDAARARGWAKRIREGKHIPAKAPDPATDWASDPEVGF
jgi:hypothetical protein